MSMKAKRKPKLDKMLSAGAYAAEPDNIAETVRKAAENSGKSAYRLAQETGLPYSIVRRWLAGGGMRSGSLSRLAAALGIDLVVDRRP